jgi:hypothetical protein
MTGVDVEVADEAVPLVGDAGTGRAVGNQRPRQPVVGTRHDRIRRRIETAVAVEDVVGIGRRKEVRRPVPDRVGDDEGVDLEAVGVGLADQILQRIESRRDRRAIRRRFERVEVPRIAAASHLREDGVRLRGKGTIHDDHDVGVRVQRRVECIDPEAAKLGARLRVDPRRVAEQNNRQQQHTPVHPGRPWTAHEGLPPVWFADSSDRGRLLTAEMERVSISSRIR